MKAALLIAEKETRQLLQTARGLSWLLAVFGILSVSALRLAIDTGFSPTADARVVYDLVGLAVTLGAVLAVLGGSDAVAGERERGSLLLLLVAPVRRRAILAGKGAGLLAAWAAVCVLSLPYLWAVSGGGRSLAGALAVQVIFGTPVVMAFGCLAMGLGARVSSARGALAAALLVLVLAASPMLPGPSVAHSAAGRLLFAADPFPAALAAAYAVIVDARPISGEAASLGVILCWLAAGAWFSQHEFQRLEGRASEPESAAPTPPAADQPGGDTP